jgi:hypothetical protein
MHRVLANESDCQAFVVDERFTALFCKTKSGRKLEHEVKEKSINDRT